MSIEKPKCIRCGAVAETYNFNAETTFWGFIETEVQTTIQRRLRVLASYYSRNPAPSGHAILNVDERKALCGDCWGDLIGKFLNGREVPAIEKKEAHRG